MKRILLSVIERLCLTGAWVAALTVSGLFLLGFVELLARNFFNTSLPFSVEYMGYLVALSLMLGAGWTLQKDGHIRITVLRDYGGLPSSRAFDRIANLFGLGVSGYFTYALFSYAFKTLASGAVSYYPSATPLGVPQLLLSFGPLFLSLAFLARLLRGDEGAEE